MKKYVCGVCGYVYDPAKGDSEAIFRPERHLRNYRRTGLVRYVGPERGIFPGII